MIIIACLGNPEKKYLKTRHNIGFIVGEYIAATYAISLGQKAFSSVNGTGKINNTEVLLLMPQTYMNNSGLAVKKALDFYKSEASQIIVIHDEIELPFGDFRHKFGGGHKGHNGLRSIIQHIGTADFHRIRFGVGRSDNPHISVADYVLSNFTPEEMDKITELLPALNEMITHLAEKIH